MQRASWAPWFWCQAEAQLCELQQQAAAAAEAQAAAEAAIEAQRQAEAQLRVLQSRVQELEARAATGVGQQAAVAAPEDEALVLLPSSLVGIEDKTSVLSLLLSHEGNRPPNLSDSAWSSLVRKLRRPQSKAEWLEALCSHPAVGGKQPWASRRVLLAVATTELEERAGADQAMKRKGHLQRLEPKVKSALETAASLASCDTCRQGTCRAHGDARVAAGEQLFQQEKASLLAVSALKRAKVIA